MASTGIHDHNAHEHQQLLERVQELNSLVRNSAYRIGLADKDDDPYGEPPALLHQVRLPQSSGRLRQRIEVLEGVYRNSQERLATALQGYEERKEQRYEEMERMRGRAGLPLANRGQEDFDSDDEGFDAGDPDLDEPYNPHRGDDGF